MNAIQKDELKRLISSKIDQDENKSDEIEFKVNLSGQKYKVVISKCDYKEDDVTKSSSEGQGNPGGQPPGSGINDGQGG